MWNPFAPPTGNQKISAAWGQIPDGLNSPAGGGFGYAKGRQPSYDDAQGNTYDAVSGKLLFAAPRPAAPAAPPAAAPPAPVLPPPVAPAARRAPAPTQVATASPRPTTGSGAADLEKVGAALGSLKGNYFQGGVPAHFANPELSVATPQQQQGMEGIQGGQLQAALSGIQPAEQDLETRRRRAFLDSSDSMAGIRAVKGVLADEVTRRGGTPAEAHQATVRGLESQLAGLGPAKGLGYDDKGTWTASNDKAGEEATLNAMRFDAPAAAPGQQPAQIAQTAFAAATPQLAPSGNLPQAKVNAFLQSDGFKDRIRSAAQPLDQIAQWQLTPQTITAPRQDPGREQALAAFAAQGAPAPTTEGEAVLALGAGNAFGTRAGQFKPGNTVSLGLLNPSKLPPLNSTGHYSGYNPGNYF